MERSEFQTRTKLEAQLTSAERELALAKKKLEHEEEERDKRREAWEQRVITQYHSVTTYKTNIVNLPKLKLQFSKQLYYINLQASVLGILSKFSTYR